MLSDKKILIVGGDRRFILLGNALKKENEVFFLGFEKETSVSPKIDFSEAKLYDYDYIMLPLPAFKKDNVLNSPYSDLNLGFFDILSLVKRNSFIFGGKLPSEFCALLRERKADYADYYQREDLTLSNAFLTAEGAVSIAVSESDFSLIGSKILILGNGRIGKALSHILMGFGAKLAVSARKSADFSFIRSNGLEALNTADVKPRLSEFDVIFNTIPKMILGAHELSEVKNGAVIIDLASAPGGVDFQFAEKNKIKAIHALGLPSKISPKTASEIILEAVCNIERERSESLE